MYGMYMLRRVYTGHWCAGGRGRGDEMAQMGTHGRDRREAGDEEACGRARAVSCFPIGIYLVPQASARHGV